MQKVYKIVQPRFIAIYEKPFSAQLLFFRLWGKSHKIFFYPNMVVWTTADVCYTNCESKLAHACMLFATKNTFTIYCCKSSYIYFLKKNSAEIITRTFFKQILFIEYSFTGEILPLPTRRLKNFVQSMTGYVRGLSSLIMP